MGVHPAYLIPIMFYKSIDHTLNQGTDNQNSQMFFDISSRQIKHLHLYGTFFIDELKFDRISSDSTFNFWSCKVGAKASNLFKKNISINVEYSMSMPITYQHRVSTLTYESNYYNMGYYLRDNSQEIFRWLGIQTNQRIAFKFLFSTWLNTVQIMNILHDGTVATHNISWKMLNGKINHFLLKQLMSLLIMHMCFWSIFIITMKEILILLLTLRGSL